MNSDQLEQIEYLFFLYCDGSISTEEMDVLNSAMQKSQYVRSKYFDFLKTDLALSHFMEQNLYNDSSAKNFLEELEAMAEYEKNAPEVLLPEEKPQRELIQKVIYPPREKRKVSKFQIFTLVMSAAAILFFILLLKFSPPKSGIEVATLADSLNAKWADITDPMDKGARLATSSDKLILRQGVAELLFDNNAKVVIEGPAEFGLLAGDRIDLQFGRVYATVPHEAIGFMVSTPTSRIIDLGTEFGVQADAFGDVQLHVIKGKTTLIAGDRLNRVNVEVTEGQAKKVSAATEKVSDIPCETELFVRDINSDHKYVWKGQTELSLADMVGGGNGFGTGQLTQWIDVLTGKSGTRLLTVKGQTVANGNVRATDNQYHDVSHLSYVDGVFSPDGGAGAVQVTSKGNLWKDCPDTSGKIYEDIYNGPMVETSLNRHALIMRGQVYGSKEKPAITLHSNTGITFDLDAIRADMPGLEITQFKSLCGVSTDVGISTNHEVSTNERIPPNSVTDFWVLVDGKRRFESLKMKAGSGPREVAVPLSKEDRFLTLVVTDSDLVTNYDWGFFAMPRLELQTN